MKRVIFGVLAILIPAFAIANIRPIEPFAAGNVITWPQAPAMIHFAGSPQSHDQAYGYWRVVLCDIHQQHKIVSSYRCYYGHWHVEETIMPAGPPGSTIEGSIDTGGDADMNHLGATTEGIPMKVEVFYIKNASWTTDAFNQRHTPHP